MPIILTLCGNGKDVQYRCGELSDESLTGYKESYLR